MIFWLTQFKIHILTEARFKLRLFSYSYYIPAEDVYDDLAVDSDYILRPPMRKRTSEVVQFLPLPPIPGPDADAQALMDKMKAAASELESNDDDGPPLTKTKFEFSVSGKPPVKNSRKSKRVPALRFKCTPRQIYVRGMERCLRSRPMGQSDDHLRFLASYFNRRRRRRR